MGAWWRNVGGIENGARAGFPRRLRSFNPHFTSTPSPQFLHKLSVYFWIETWPPGLQPFQIIKCCIMAVKIVLTDGVATLRQTHHGGNTMLIVKPYDRTIIHRSLSARRRRRRPLPPESSQPTIGCIKWLSKPSSS